MAETTCAYCGQIKDTTEDHVVARNLFDKRRIRAEAKFVKVPTCKECNGAFSSDEEHFRDFAILAGSFTGATEGVFKNEMLRSLRQQVHGKRKLDRLMSRIKQQTEGGNTVYRIHLTESDFRIFRKIIRGLAYHHFQERFPEELVQVVQNTWSIRPEYLEDGVWHVIHPDVFRYRIESQSLTEGEHSYWFLEFFNTVQIVGRVTLPQR